MPAARNVIRALISALPVLALTAGIAAADQGWRYVVQPQFQSADLFEGGVASVKVNNRWGLIDNRGQWRVKPVHEDIRGAGEGLRAVKKGPLWGFMDGDGRLVVPHRYLDAGTFSEGFAPVKAPKGWRMIDRQGREMFRESYALLEGLSEGVAVAKRGKALGFLRRKDWGFVPVKGAERLYSLSEGLAVVVVKGRRGFVDASGRTVIKPTFQAATRFNGGHAGVKIKGKWAVIDRKGRVVLNRGWSSMRSFSEGWAAYRTAKGLWGYSAANGKTGLPARYTNAFAFRDGIAIVRDGEKRYFIDRKGRHLTEPVFDDVFRFAEGLAPVKQGARWGYIALVRPKPKPLATKTPVKPLDQLLARLADREGLIHARLGRWNGSTELDDSFDPEDPATRIRGRLGAGRAEAERAIDDAITGLLALLPEDGGLSLAKNGPARLADQLDSLASLLNQGTYFGAAERLTRQAMAISEKAGITDPKDTGRRLALILDGQLRAGRLDDADRTLAAMNGLDQEPRHLHDTVVASLHGAISQVNPADLDDPSMARLYDMLVAVNSRDLGADAPETLEARIRQARIHFFAGRLAEARQIYDQLVPRLWPDLETRYRSLYWARREVFRNQGLIAFREGRLDQAEAFMTLADGFNDVYAMAETDAGHPHVAITPGLDLARLYARRGAFDKAESLLTNRLGQSHGTRPSDQSVLLSALVRILLDQGRRDEAKAAFEQFAPPAGAERDRLRRALLVD